MNTTSERPAAQLGSLCIEHAQLADGSIVNICIDQGRVTSISAEACARASSADRRIDATGLLALPGLVDLHTHLREPGYEQSETVRTGSQAAATGGFCTVFPMANTLPVADAAGVVEQVYALGIAAGYAEVQPIGAVTQGLAGELLSEIGAMAHSRAHVRVFSDDGRCVHDSLLMRRALEYVSSFDGVIAQHAQDPQLTVNAQINESQLSSELGLAGWPAVAEESIIARDVLLAEHVGARLHICHLSTAGSVEIVRLAKARGIQVTAEVTPHHLLLDEERVRGYDARYKVNPPLRRAEDVLALRAAVADGTIDIIATDHAPHPSEAKECEWESAAFGMVGLESALPVVQTALIDTGYIGWEAVPELLSAAPARIASLIPRDPAAAEQQERISPSPYGAIRVGAAANITLYDPAATSVFSPEQLGGKSSNSPFFGVELSGSVRYTLLHGYLTYDNGTLVDPDTVAAKARSWENNK